MRKMLAALLGLVLGALVWIAAVPAPAHAVSCTTHYSSDYRYVKEPVTGLPDPVWRIMHELRYRHCKQGARRWVDPLSAEIGCREESNTRLGGLRKTYWRMRYWDHDHHEKRRKTGLECNRADWTTKILYFPKMQKFHRCAAGSPRWRARVKFDIAAGDDAHSTLAGHWWGYSGPVAVRC
jgi:hypothetical protein